jgi:AcrR family transcriptional regulator
VRSRDAILNATLGLIEVGGFEAVSISAVAQSAGVTRQTVYNTFGTKEDLVSQTVLASAGEAFAQIQAAADAVPEGTGHIAEFFVAARRICHADPLLARLLRAEPGNPIFDEGMMERAHPVAAMLLGDFRAREPVLADDATFDALVELLTRLGISVLFFESAATADDDGLRAFVLRWVTPLFDTSV